MDRTYGQLLLLQAVLGLANAMAAVFAIIFLVDQDAFTGREAILPYLIAFAIAPLGCVAFWRSRPRRPRALMAAGLGLLAASYLAYLVLRGWPLLLFVGVTWGAYIPLFFLPFNALVISTTRAEDRVGKLGSFILVLTAVSIAGPSLGGILIARFGYSALFGTAALVLVLNAALLLRLPRGGPPTAFAFDLRGMGGRTGVALFAQGSFEGIASGAIPVIAYSFATAAVDLGALFSLFALAGGVTTVALGTWSDRLRNRRPFLVVGAATSILACVLVVIASTLPGFAVGNSALALTSSVAPTFLYAIAVERLAGRPAAAILTREVLLNTGRAASLAAFFVLVSLGLSVQHAFVLAAVSLAFVALGNPARSPAQGAHGGPDRGSDDQQEESDSRVQHELEELEVAPCRRGAEPPPPPRG